MGKRLLASWITGLVLLAWLPAGAGAHAAFQDASPEPGARLQTAPSEIVLVFTEPLNRSLTKATLIDSRSRAPVPARATLSGDRLVLRPSEALATGPYRVDWHTVSRLDGHALEGSFGFGVRASAGGGAATLEQSPLARDGWARIALRAILYLAAVFFGGSLLPALFLTRRGPTAWLDPARHGETQTVRVAAVRARVAGMVAALAATAVALAETSDAAGGLSAHDLDAYLLSSQSGAARLGTALALLVVAALYRRAWRLSAAVFLAALLGIAVGGHANSASPRVLAVGSDWLHLAAGTLWIGGIAQLAAAWLPGLAQHPAAFRRRLMRDVLAPFGRVALPAFAVVVAAGTTNALVELGHVSELWTTDYGTALTAKIVAVGVVAVLSFLHAIRLRPRLANAPIASASRRERQHWRLLAGEPWVGAVILALAALLAVFPLPPRQLLEKAEAGPPRATAQSHVAAARPDELAVAGHAGPYLVAGWITRGPDGLAGIARLYDANLRPPAATASVAGAHSTSCGRGCVRFTGAPRRGTLTVDLAQRRARYSARLPARWRSAGDVTARRLAARATAAMRSLRSVDVDERLSSGTGRAVRSRYRLQTPDRYTLDVNSTATPNQTIVIGRRSWTRRPGGPWRANPPDDPVDVRSLFPWTAHLRAARQLPSPGPGLDEVALADPGAPTASRPPFWFRLVIDRATNRILRLVMTAQGHFMSQRYSGFNRATAIRPPR